MIPLGEQLEKLKELGALQKRACEAYSRRLEEFAVLYRDVLSRLTISVSSEYTIHLNSGFKTFMALSEELQQWLSDEKPDPPFYAEKRSRIHEFGWERAVWSLDGLVSVLEPRKFEQYVELLKVIVDKEHLFLVPNG
jgi:hypothetical protein